jgi:modulator of FtsH protease HflK
MRRMAPVLIAIGVLLAAALATGAVVVAPGEVMVVRRLGRTLPQPWAPGLHLGWPFGLDRIIRVRTDEVRRMEIGLAGVPGPEDEPGAGEYLSGDLNLLRARGIVQYRVADPAAFALRAAAVEPLLAHLTESSLSRALSRRGIDSILRHERAEVVRDVEADLARAVDRLRLGLAILGVSLTDARPPAEVAPDFAAAQATQSEHDRRINEAKTYEATVLPAATAQALARVEQARARADRAVALARSRSSRFLALLGEAERSRRLTVRRLYLDALRDLLPRVRRKLVLTSEEPIDLSILGVGP